MTADAIVLIIVFGSLLLLILLSKFQSKGPPTNNKHSVDSYKRKYPMYILVVDHEYIANKNMLILFVREGDKIKDLYFVVRNGMWFWYPSLKRCNSYYSELCDSYRIPYLKNKKL